MRIGLFLVLVFAIPALAFAGNLLGGPLASCANPPECQACDLVRTANNIIRFAVAFSVIVATLVFTYAGILYMTAAADPKNIEKAHTMFKSVFVGLVILLVAWLVVDIVMRTLTESRWGPWNEISCGNWPGAGVIARGGTGIPQSPSNPTSAPYTPASGRCAPMTSGPCSVQNLTPQFGSNATMMSSICRWEMGGRPGPSGTDRLWYGNNEPFSFGIFQANIATNVIYCPDGTSYNCPAAFSPPANPGETRPCPGAPQLNCRATSGWGMTIRDRDLYNQCAERANDSACSAETARRKLGSPSNPNTNHWRIWQQNCGAAFGEGR